MAVDADMLTQLVLRWIHFVSGVLWIGLLYYFNVVQAPAFKAMDGPVRSQNIQRLVPRALFWFRYGALVTVLSGALLLWMEWTAFSTDERWKWSIGAGATLGIIMFLNVWGIIWPNQKKVIQANVEAAKTQQPVNPQAAQWGKSAFIASRTNVLLSFPMLWFMASAQHGLDLRTTMLTGAVIFVLGALWLYAWTHMKPASASQSAPASGATKP